MYFAVIIDTILCMCLLHFAYMLCIVYLNLNESLVRSSINLNIFIFKLEVNFVWNKLQIK